MKSNTIVDIHVNLYDNDNQLIGCINKHILVVHRYRDNHNTFRTSIIRTLIDMYNVSKNINDVSKYIIINDNTDRYIIEVQQIGNSNNYKTTLEIQNSGYLIFECEVNFMIDAINKLDAAYKDLHCS